MGNANKLYKVIVSDRAAGMLMQHVRFLAQTSFQAAEKLRAELVGAAESLKVLPERNAWFSDPVFPVNKYRKMVISKRYLLIYQVKKDTVFVECVLDCRQDYKWLI